MTLATTTNKVNYTANGVLTNFSFTFKTINESDLIPYLDDVAQSVGYTVNLNADQDTSPGGSVDFDTAPADQVAVTLVREVPYTQETDYTPYDPFPAETHELALDNLTMQTQQNAEELGRATKAPISDDGTTDFTLPAYEASKGIKWDPSSKELINTTYDPDAGATAAAASAAAAASSASDASDSAVAAASSASDASDSADAAAVSAATSADIASTVAGTDTYTATLGISDYESGKTYYLTFTNANTSTTPTLNLDAKGAKTIKKDGSAALVAGDIPAGHAALVRYDGTDMILLNPVSTFIAQYIKLTDVKSSGTGGGAFTQDVWQTRTLNTEDEDTGGNCSLSANQFTLDIGTYEIEALAPVNAVARHKLRLQNITDTTTEILGTSAYAAAAFDAADDATLFGRFTITAEKVFELQHKCSTTKSNGLGQNSTLGVDEVYATVILRKVA